MTIKRCTDVVTERQLEQTQATIVQQQATIEYLAMMTDVELPDASEKEENIHE